MTEKILGTDAAPDPAARLQRIQARIEESLVGPWTVARHEEFIVYARSDVVWLVDQLTRATATIQQLTDERAYLTAKLKKALQRGAGRAQAPRENGLASASASDWQPIDTAPKDGARVIAWGPRLAVAECEYRLAWHNDAEGWYRSNQHPCVGPTHWMPLPDPPKGSA